MGLPVARIRGKTTLGNTAVTNVASTANLDVSSTANIQALNVAGATILSGATTQVGLFTPELLAGADAWRGTATIALSGTMVVVSATNVSTVNPPVAMLGQTTNAPNRSLVLSVNSVKSGISFMIVANAAASAAQEVVYISII